MGQPHSPRLSRTLPPASVRVDGLDAALVGSSDSAILRGSGSSVAVGTAISLATTAANGSIFTLLERGVYAALLIADHTLAAAAQTACGISLNTDSAGLTADPDTSVTGMLDAYDQILNGAGAQQPIVGLVTFRVRAQEISAGVALGGSGALLRFHGTDGAGGAPGIVNGAAHTRLQVMRLRDLA